jgi:hypothetical protein
VIKILPTFRNKSNNLNNKYHDTFITIHPVFQIMNKKRMCDKFMGRHIMPVFDPPLKKGGEGGFFAIFIHKISPLPAGRQANPSRGRVFSTLPKRGRLRDFITSKITDISDCLIAFRLWPNSAFFSGLPIFLSQAHNKHKHLRFDRNLLEFGLPHFQGTFNAVQEEFFINLEARYLGRIKKIYPC